MDGNRIYLVSEVVDYEGINNVYICKNLKEVVYLFNELEIIKEKDGEYYKNVDINYNWDYLTVKYRDLDSDELEALEYKENVLEVEDKIIRSENQQSALGAVLSAKVGLNNIKSYEVVHDKNFMITDINISLNTRDQAIINNTHREVSQHFAANLYGIEINITKPTK